MRVQAANKAALEASSGTPSLDPFKTQKNWGAAWCLSPIGVFKSKCWQCRDTPRTQAANEAFNPPGPVA